ncbi:hypothetical protein [Actinophytocola sp.]|uniref:hypothetical protein n=1 Tax=Actinophytocola sp. TaxID=1872138 RepID=UPI002ED4BBDE
MADPEGFGSSESVQTLGAAARQTGGELERLTEQVNRDVMDTVPDRWGGDAASAMQRHWYRFSMAIKGIGSPLDTYAKGLEVAAKSMARARQELEDARRFADRNGLFIQPDLTVRAYMSDRQDAAALIGIAQTKVNGAKQLADEARTQIRTANTMLEKHAVQAKQEMQEIIDAMSGGGGGRRGGRRLGIRRQGRRDTDDQLDWGVEGRIRLPRKGAGDWVEGRPGHGVWVPHRPGDYGLHPGESIRWRDGVPDLSEHRLPLDRIPGAREPNLTGMRLTGEGSVDNKLGDEALARQFGRGWTPESVKAWRNENDLIYHHYSTSELQLVPGRIHRALPHQGGASEAR